MAIVRPSSGMVASVCRKSFHSSYLQRQRNVTDMKATLRDMSHNDPYPATVAEVLDDAMTFKPTALAALREFKKSHPWRGSIDERHAKLRTLHDALCAAYGLNPP